MSLGPQGKGGPTEIFHCRIDHGPYGAKLQMLQVNQVPQKGAPTMNEKITYIYIHNNKNNSRIG